MYQPTLREPRILSANRPDVACDNRQRIELLEAQQARSHTVVDVVIVVCDLVCQISKLRLQRRSFAAHEALPHFTQLTRIAQGAVLENAFAGLEAEIQTVERRIALFKDVHHAQRLQIVLEAAMVL